MLPRCVVVCVRPVPQSQARNAIMFRHDCRVCPRLSGLSTTLSARVAAEPDATISELRRWVLTEHDVQISHRAMWRSLARLGLTRKKHLRAAEQERPDIVAARADWAELIPKLDPSQLIFLDG